MSLGKSLLRPALHISNEEIAAMQKRRIDEIEEQAKILAKIVDDQCCEQYVQTFGRAMVSQPEPGHPCRKCGRRLPNYTTATLCPICELQVERNNWRKRK